MGTICDLKPGETAPDALNGMAGTATATVNIGQPQGRLVVVYPPDRRDHALQWTEKRYGVPYYWPSYCEAIGPLSAREKFPLKRQLLASLMMEKYYEFGIQALPETNDDAENARKNLERQSNAIGALTDKNSYSEFCKSAGSIAAELESITLYLIGLDMGMADIPCLKQCLAGCSKVIGFVARNPKGLPTFEVVKAILGTLAIVRNALESILKGYSTVTNNESLPSFFLMRLLVGYQIKLSRRDEEVFRGIASAQLTALLHNRQDWLFGLMQQMIADLATALQPFEDDVCFFLKGGRGMSYLLKDPTKGENDWDTQILINPELGWDEWCACYREVRDVVNNRLLRYNFIFSASLMKNARTLIEATNEVAAMAVKDPERYDKLLDSIFTLVWQNGLEEQAIAADAELALEGAWKDAAQNPGGNCKAELIDVSLPRFCTVELLEQWRHVRDGIKFSNGIPYPGPAYFIKELIMLIREGDADASPSRVKRPKRLDRLLSLLSPAVDGFSEFRDKQLALAKAAGLTDTLERIAAIDSEPNRGLATIMLGQFCTAYQLAADPNLAKAFDKLAAYLLNQFMGRDQKNALADVIFKWCQGVSAIMTGHLAVRGQALFDQLVQIAALVQTVEARTIEPVIQGSFATNCLYRQIAAEAIIRNRVAPAAFADIHLYFQNCASAADITPSMVQALQKAIQTFAATSAYFGDITVDQPPTSIKVFAQQPIELEQWSYRPLAIEFKLKQRAQLTTVTGPELTLLGMGPLIFWCRERAAEVSEWAMQQQLNETFGALIEMQAEPWLAPPIPKTAKY